METANTTLDAALSFDQLRTEGVSTIQRLSAGRWTDYNIHDPGITLLEVLCYALTDVAYRSHWSIPDLIGSDSSQRLSTQYGIEKVLPSAPVTLNDLRKKLLDVNGVLNVDIQPMDNDPAFYYSPYEHAITTAFIEGIEPAFVQGFYQVSIAGKPNDNEVKAILNSCRPLACDWAFYVNYKDTQPLKLMVSLEISADVTQPDQLAQTVQAKISAYITPSVSFTSYADEMRKGTPNEEVYEGILLNHGYLADSELDKLNTRDNLWVSDLIQILMDIAGVVAVKDIYFQDGLTKNRWSQPITPNKYPILNRGSELSLSRGNHQTQFVLENGTYRQVSPAPATNQKMVVEATDLKASKVRNRNVERYYSIRHHLPALFGLGENQMSNMSVPARQLSGYLIFFEQLLTDALAQLAQAGQLLDFDNTAEVSYAVQVLPNAVDFMMLPNGQKAGVDVPYFLKQLKKTLQDAANPADQSNDRFNRALDHLMARFGENFADYALLMYDKPTELIANKRAFVKDLPQFGTERGLGFNYKIATSRSGLEHKIALCLGLNPQITEGGQSDFYLIEHILLRIVETDGQPDDNLISDVFNPDPYSRTVTFVFKTTSPNIPNTQQWRNLTEQIARRETPAHLRMHIIWLETVEFTTFSQAYAAWRNALKNTDGFNNMPYRVARDRVVDLLVKDEQFIIGWHLPILDLAMATETPFIPANTEGGAAILYNSQMGVDYTLCDYYGTSLAAPIEGKGVDLRIPLPILTEDTTFRLLASKKIVKNGVVKKEIASLLIQKLRVRVGLDTTILVTPPANLIRYDSTTTLKLTSSQAEVTYRLVDAQNRAVSVDYTGVQGQPITLVSNPLQEDLVISIEAEGDGRTSYFPNKYAIKVLPNQNLALSADSVVDYDQKATVKIAQAQGGINYSLAVINRFQFELLSHKTPTIWDADALKTASLPVSTEIMNQIETAIFSPKDNLNARFTPTGSAVTPTQMGDIEIETDALTDDVVIFTLAKKAGHPTGVLERQFLPVLVKPDLSVVATPADTSVQAGESTTILIANPQPYTLYSLVTKDTTEILSSGMYSPIPEDGIDPLSIGNIRVGYDFFVFEGTVNETVQLQTPTLTATTTFEILAEKVQTGVKGTLTSSIVIEVEPNTETAA